MRLAFGGIEAASPEAAAAIARDKPTDQADSIDDECDGETLAALVDVAGDEAHRHTRAIDFEPERQRKAARRLLAALKDLLGDRPSVQDFQCIRCGRDYRAYDELETGDCPSDDCPSYHARVAIAEAEAAGITPAPGEAGFMPYSVLLLYPDDVNDGGHETYYAFVTALDPIAAVTEARRQALATNEWTEDDVDPAGFVPLLVTEGHHYGQPTSHD
jgi:hypothetical protein